MRYARSIPSRCEKKTTKDAKDTKAGVRQSDEWKAVEETKGRPGKVAVPFVSWSDSSSVGTLFRQSSSLNPTN